MLHLLHTFCRPNRKSAGTNRVMGDTGGKIVAAASLLIFWRVKNSRKKRKQVTNIVYTFFVEILVSYNLISFSQKLKVLADEIRIELLFVWPYSG